MQTTKELIQNLQNRIANYNPEDEGDTTKEELQTLYKMAKEIGETLALTEIRLIWYLRNTQRGDTFRFMKTAQKLYEGNIEFKSLTEPLPKK